METGEALCCYKVTRKDELLQDIYLDEDIFPNTIMPIYRKLWRDF